MTPRYTLATLLALLAACTTPQTNPNEATVAAHHKHHGQHGQHGHNHDFKGAEAWAARFNDPARDAWQRPDEVVTHLDLREGMTVADLGAGTGYFEPRLAEAVGATGKVLALDAEPDMIRYLQTAPAITAHPHIIPTLIPTDAPNLPANTVHRILIVDTWHHLSDREAYAAKLREALTSDGLLLIVDFTPDAPEGPPPAMRLTSDQISAELRAAGFAVELVTEDLPRQYVLRARPANP